MYDAGTPQKIVGSYLSIASTSELVSLGSGIKISFDDVYMGEFNAAVIPYM